MPEFNIKTIKAFHIRENFQSLYKEPAVYNVERMLKRWYFLSNPFKDKADNRCCKDHKETLAWDYILGEEQDR